MEGLLQWAADVVGGNGNSSSPNQQDDIPFQFTKEQQEYVRSLDAKAASLQQSLRQLRHRILPPSPPFLHAHSNSALTMELNAHKATLAQAQMREASLQTENASYLKAISTVKQQTKEKAQEAIQLQSRLKELEARDEKLNAELERLQTLLADKEHTKHGSESDTRGEPIKLASISMEEKVSIEADELQRTKAELKLWEAKVDNVEKEWTMLQQNLVRWPSPAQRENELERRLRSLSEQLIAKQAQAELLANERDALDFQLSQAIEARQQSHSSNVSGRLKRNKIGRNELSSSSRTASHSFLLQSKIKSQFGSMNSSHMARTGLLSNLYRFGNLGNTLNWLKDKQSRMSMTLRVVAVAYILGLHIFVFFILSFSGFHGQ